MPTTTHTPVTKSDVLPTMSPRDDQCVNWPTHWHDARWQSCAYYERSALEGCGPYALAHAREDGTSADDACCICGGGRQQQDAQESATEHLEIGNVHAEAAITTEAPTLPVRHELTTRSTPEKLTESTALQQFLGIFVERSSTGTTTRL